MLRLYDTRTRQVEAIEPARRGLLRMYSCGPTVYRHAHVGNLRTYLLADLIRRNAEHRHHLSVLACQNITDVGHLTDDDRAGHGQAGQDKVLAQARAEGRSALELARFYEDAFRADCAALNLRPAEYTPRASEWVGLMIEMIARLIETGHAYPTPDGSVYFDARSFPAYGELSGNRLDDLRPARSRPGPLDDPRPARSRPGPLDDPRPARSRPSPLDDPRPARSRPSPLDDLRPARSRPGPLDDGEAGRAGAAARAGAGAKRFHADWALWKGAPGDRELTWAAPWGTGFPGWHTECSALSLHHLGDIIDIHTGGIDLRFPHHEDERAQSNTVTGHEVVQHWVHGEHLLFEGRKMAKSTQNVVLVADLADRGLDPLALRLTFLEHRYRQQMNLTWDTLDAADGTLRRWRHLVAEWACSPSKPMDGPVAAQVAAAFDDDLDTPAALRALRVLEKDPDVPPGSKFESFAHADQLLGLDLARDVGRAPAEPPLPDGARPRLAAREAARAARDWATSDRLREELAAIGVAVCDTAAGQTWRVRSVE